MNRKAWQILARVLGVDPSRVIQDSLPEAAHMISGDNVMNLARLAASGRSRVGERVLLVMSGYGMNWQAALLEVA
jgi:3-oxoacyl-[acyl-carrier-protein] synthase III